MLQRAALLLIATLLASCSALMPPASSGPDSAAANERMQTQAAQMIVVAVANQAGTIGVRAGSIPRAYAGDDGYGASDRAQATLDEFASRFALSPIAAWSIAPLKLQCVVFQLPDHASRDEVLAALSHDARVRIAEPLQTFRTLGALPGDGAAAAKTTSAPPASPYNDPYWQLQRGFAQVDAGGAQQWSSGEGVRVAIVDTGADAHHEDLRGRVALTRDFVGNGGDSFTSDRHGTEVAGIIAAVANNHQGIVGVAPRATLLVLKACWQLQPGADAAECNSFTLAEAIGAAIQGGAQIINLSLGGPADPLLTALVRNAIERGIIVTGAVPPDGAADGFPVGVPGDIAVDRSDRGSGAAHEVRAPGSEILTLTPGGHYDFVSGSSFATAHVSGTIALLLSKSPQLDAATIDSLLQNSVVKADSASVPVQPSINACHALSALERKLRAPAQAGNGCGAPPRLAATQPPT